MPSLYSSKHIIHVLENNGFYLVSQKGSHAKFYKIVQDRTVIIIVPVGKKEIPIGTFHSILRQAGMKKDNFK